MDLGIWESTYFGLDVRFLYSFIHAAASNSAVPPISPISTIPSVLSSCSKIFKASTKLVPARTSPPIPMHKLWPSPALVVDATAIFYQKVLCIKQGGHLPS